MAKKTKFRPAKVETHEEKTARFQRDLTKYTAPILPLFEAFPDLLNPPQDAWLDPNGLTLCVARKPIGKAYTKTDDGFVLTEHADEKLWYFYPLRITTLKQLADLHGALLDCPNMCLIRGAPRDGIYLWGRNRRSLNRTPDGHAPSIVDASRYWVMLDIDGMDMPPGHSYADAEALATWLKNEGLPRPFRGCQCVIVFSASAATATHSKVKAHVFMRMGQGVVGSVLRAVLAKAGRIDSSTATANHIWFTNCTINGAPDPLGDCRFFLFDRPEDGPETVDVVVEVGDAIAEISKKMQSRNVAIQQRTGITKHYLDEWEQFAIDQMGYGKTRWGKNRLGYNVAIFEMLKIALKAEETDFERMKTVLRDIVMDVAAARGDLPDKQSALDRYLTDRELDRRIADAAGQVEWDEADHVE